MGIEGHKWQMFDGSTLLFQLDLNNHLKDKTKYPYILFLPQHTTESLLIDKLASYGVQVQWNRKVLTMESEADGVKVGFEDGTTEFAHYVVGADGNRSVVGLMLVLTAHR
jgi:2-polyprenyl-6-methoxyphenol hydroxylase-like FAD-dependent oxidoreductase